MRIALDYDDTFTLDPSFWGRFISAAFKAGHEVVICTLRMKTVESCKEIRKAIFDECFDYGAIIPILFANHEWKIDATKKAGHDIDVWIDDSPQFIAPPFTLLDIERYQESGKH